MKFICDENIDKSVVKYLRNNGFDILFIREIQRGMKDVEIIQKANAEKRIIITKDKDFGELIFRLNYKCYGVILLRIDETFDYSYHLSRILEEYKDKIENNFIVVTSKTIRIRKYFSNF